MKNGIIALVWMALAGVTGCAPAMIQGSSVEATPENLEVWNQVEEYRISLEERDPKRLMGLISREYFDNFATTDRSEDDYGYAKLEEKMAPVLRSNAKKVRMNIRLTQIRIVGDTAEADFEYSARFLLSDNGRDVWETRQDFNAALAREQTSGEFRLCLPGPLDGAAPLRFLPIDRRISSHEHPRIGFIGLCDRLLAPEDG